MRLTNRDLLVLKTLNKLRVLDIDTITLLCGFTRYNKCADRLNILYENGYVDYNQMGVSTKKYYFLKQKGMNVLFPPKEVKTKKGTTYIKYKEPAKYRQSNVEHEIMVARVLHYLLQCNPELTIDDFITDRDIQCSMTPKQRKKFRHASDLICGKYRIKVEVELTKKDIKRVQNNVAYNGNTYTQLWFTGNTPVHNLLLKVKKKFVYYDVHVLSLDELHEIPVLLSELHEGLLKRKPELRKKNVGKKKKDVNDGQMTIDDFLK